MAAVRNIIVRAGADINPLQRGMTRGQNVIRNFSRQANSHLGIMGVTIGNIFANLATRAIYATGQIAQNAVKDFATTESAAMGLQSILQAQGKSFSEAQGFIKSYVADGLVPLTDATTAFKQMSAAGYSIGDTEKILLRIKDAAAFNRQASLTMGEAVRSATEGIKNENSILVDNSGITKNLSVMWKEYAASIGTTFDKLTAAQKRTATLNGIMRESQFQMGDAAKYAGTLGGGMAMLQSKMFMLSSAFGSVLAPALAIIIQPLATFITWLTAGLNVLGQFMKALFGVNTENVNLSTTTSEAAAAQTDLGNATEKAAKKAKKSVMAFDEVNQLQEDMADSAGGAAGAVGGGISTPIPAKTEPPDLMPNFYIWKAARDFKLALGEISQAISDFYTNWGMKDIVDGIKRGISNFNFQPLTSGFQNIGSQLQGIITAAAPGLQKASKALGEMIGTAISGAITTSLTMFETITTGISNFFSQNSASIKTFIDTLTANFATGFNNLKTSIDTVFTTITTALSKKKTEMSATVTNISTSLWKIAETTGTIVGDMFRISTDKIKTWTTENKTKIQTLLTDIIGIFTTAFNTLSIITNEALALIKGFWDQWGKDIFAKFTEFLLGLVSWTMDTFNNQFKPIWDNLMVEVKKVWDGGLSKLIEALQGFVGRISVIVLDVWNKFIKPIATMFKDLFESQIASDINTTIKILGTFIRDLMKIQTDIFRILSGITDFITGVFTGNWTKAWNGVKNVFSSIVNLLGDIFKVPLNAIIGLINKFIGKLNSIKIEVPSIDLPGVGRVGGGTIGFPRVPTIPTLDQGAVVTGPTLAQLSQNNRPEAVIPLDSSGGFIDSISSAIGNAVITAMQFTQGSSSQGGNSGSGDIVVKIDGTQLARILIPYTAKENDRLGNNAILQGV